MADLGLTLVAGQLINRHHQDQNRLLSNLFAFRVVSATLIIGLAPLVTYLLPYDAEIGQGVWLASGAFWFVALNQIFVSLFQKTLTTERIAIAEIVSRALLALGAWLVVVFDLGLNGVFWVMLLANAVNFLIHYFLSRSLAKISWAFDLIVWRKIISLSWPLLTTIVLNLVYLKADIIILSFLRSEAEVGLYGAAYKVIDVLVSLPFVFAGLILPLLVSHWSSGHHEKYLLVKQKFFDYTVALAAPLTVGGIILAGPIMRLVAGPDFAASGRVLQVLMLAVLAVFISCFFTHLMISREQQKRLIPYYIFTAVTALPLYYFLIVNYGYLGAAWATVYSETAMALGSALALRRLGGVNLHWNVVLRIISATALMSAAVLAMLPIINNQFGWLILAVALGATIYILALVAFGVVNRQDLNNLIGRRLNGPSINQL